MQSFRRIICSSIVVAFFSFVVLEFFNNCKPKHPYAGLNVEQLIQKYEYPVEIHHVTTEDGYILTLHRIPHGKNNSFHRRTPVLLLPGATQNAWDYVYSGPNNSLSFLLAEMGYDIWLGNIRGTTWSRKHTTLNPDKDPAFWNYTTDELGVYDVPAFIDHILEVTDQSSLHYIGFSQGVTIFCIMGSEKSEYLSKVKLLTALGPALFFSPLSPKSPFLRFITNNFDAIEVKQIFRFFNYHEIFKRGDVFTRYLEYICNENSIFINICLSHLFSICGDDYDELPKNIMSLTTSNFPSGMSITQLKHIFQMIRLGNFKKYDYGIQGNLEKYGEENPPSYNLSKITTPVAVYYGSNDWVNVDELITILPNVVKTYNVPWEKFSHIDFFISKNVVRLLHNAVIDEILKH